MYLIDLGEKLKWLPRGWAVSDSMSHLLITVFMFQLGSRESGELTSNSENLSLGSGGYHPVPLMSNRHVEKGIVLNVCI